MFKELYFAKVGILKEIAKKTALKLRKNCKYQQK
jgi:hypothetical protein